MVMSDDAIELVLQKWAWAKGEEAAMKLVVVSDLQGSRVFQNWHVGPMSFTMLGEMHSNFRKKSTKLEDPMCWECKTPLITNRFETGANTYRIHKKAEVPPGSY